MEWQALAAIQSDALGCVVSIPKTVAIIGGGPAGLMAAQVVTSHFSKGGGGQSSQLNQTTLSSGLYVIMFPLMFEVSWSRFGGALDEPIQVASQFKYH